MTSWWLSYELHFQSKTHFSVAARYELENLRLKICCMTRSTVIAYQKKMLRANFFQNLLFMTSRRIFWDRAILHKILLCCEANIKHSFHEKSC